MSTMLHSAMERVGQSFATNQKSSTPLLYDLASRSFLISADMAHAVHPNYSDRHEECHRPVMHGGIVIKHNPNQRYATSARTAAYLKSLAARLSIPTQDFVVRNDSPCGNTIGPIVSAKLGIPAVDIGLAQWSMHSIR